MHFDPSRDYALRDFANDEENLLFQFGELIKTLITLASDGEKQVEIIGIGGVADEMAEDFNSFFTLPNKYYLESGLLNNIQLSKLNELDAFLDERSGDEDSAFWDDLKLSTHPDWIVVRRLAKEILDLLGMNHLSIEIERQEKYKWTLKGKKLASQTTKTRLIVNKNG